ncbi:2Fe-2S iron-sulfur cluster-binding protein [Aurantivibrio plasticivorans]
MSSIKVTYISHDGNEQTVETAAGTSVMQAAVDNMVPGIDGDCGGSCSCATCHVFVDDAFTSKLDELSESEADMLELRPDRQANSRLACQIILDDTLDGIKVTTPEFQY